MEIDLSSSTAFCIDSITSTDTTSTTTAASLVSFLLSQLFKMFQLNQDPYYYNFVEPKLARKMRIEKRDILK